MPRMLKKAVWFIAAAVVILALFLPGYTKLQDLKEKSRDLQDKIKRLSIENALLEQELKRIASDPLYQERIAREKMGVVRKGEIPVKIIPEQPTKQ
ncbi:MAG TPA: septum formation initiator family protein [Patescibacteria group bacterium]|nr:septum formation initiator family protein [Patescibacteria group bacterium]